jgi:hypothetical protein
MCPAQLPFYEDTSDGPGTPPLAPQRCANSCAKLGDGLKPVTATAGTGGYMCSAAAAQYDDAAADALGSADEKAAIDIRILLVIVGGVVLLVFIFVLTSVCRQNRRAEFSFTPPPMDGGGGGAYAYAADGAGAGMGTPSDVYLDPADLRGPSPGGGGGVGYSTLESPRMLTPEMSSLVTSYQSTPGGFSQMGGGAGVVDESQYPMGNSALFFMQGHTPSRSDSAHTVSTKL